MSFFPFSFLFTFLILTSQNSRCSSISISIALARSLNFPKSSLIDQWNKTRTAHQTLCGFHIKICDLKFTASNWPSFLSIALNRLQCAAAMLSFRMNLVHNGLSLPLFYIDHKTITDFALSSFFFVGCSFNALLECQNEHLSPTVRVLRKLYPMIYNNQRFASTSGTEIRVSVHSGRPKWLSM